MTCYGLEKPAERRHSFRSVMLAAGSWSLTQGNRLCDIVGEICFGLRTTSAEITIPNVPKLARYSFDELFIVKRNLKESS